jgi:hypothetical protein
MGAGVDPTQMCRRLVDKVGRWEQLFAVADPNLLILFEDWLEALEEEVVTLVRDQGSADPDQVSQKLGLSPAGAAFLLTKLKQEGRLA